MLKKLSSSLWLFVLSVTALTACAPAARVASLTDPIAVPQPTPVPLAVSREATAESVVDITPDATPRGYALGSINGWLWHDWCPVSGQPIGAGKETTGCVQEGDHYRANGVKEDNEAIIPYVRVNLGAGPCPSIGLAETETLVTDLSYSFMATQAGTYCVSIDPLAGSNPSSCTAGAWTYPNRQDGVISTTVNLSASVKTSST